jgi:shikimate kinase
MGHGGVALGGFMGVGKTTIGRILGVRLGWPFVDLDDELVRRFGPITDQWVASGEAVFRQREREVLRYFCDGARRVLATGGGTWVSPANRAMLSESYDRCVLTADVDTLRIRIARSSARPLASRWEELWAQRKDAYEDADFTVSAEADPEQVAGAIARILVERGRI